MKLMRLELGMALLLFIATLGFGGDHPTSLLVWHGILLLLVLLELCCPTSRDRSVAGGAFLGLLLFLAWAWFGFAMAPYKFAAWLNLQEIMAFLLVVWLAVRHGLILLTRLLPVLLVIVLFQGGLTVWQRFALGLPRPAGTFLNTNHLAGWLVAVLFLAAGAGWLTSTERTARRGLAAAAFLLGGMAVVLGASRGAALGLIAGGITLAALSWNRWSRSVRRTVTVAGLVLFLGAAGILGFRAMDGDPFRYQRLRIWRASIQLVFDSPWLGSGPGQLETAARNLQFPDGVGPLRYDRHFSGTHSDLLRPAVEYGWPGALLVLVAVVLAARALWARASKVGAPKIACGGLAALAALAAQSSVENLSHRPAVYLLVGAIVGSLLSTERSASKSLTGPTRLGIALPLLLVFIIGDLAPFLAWDSVRDLARGRLEAGDLARLERALRLNPLHPDYHLRLADHLLPPEGEWSAEDYARAREAAERATRLNPRGSREWAGLARLELRAFDQRFRDVATRRRVSRSYRQAEALSRFDARLPAAHAGFLLNGGDPVAARRVAERALALEPEAVLPRLLLADAFAEIGERDRARVRLEEARELARRGAPYADENDYSRLLLHLDEGTVGRIRRKIELE